MRNSEHAAHGCPCAPQSTIRARLRPRFCFGSGSSAMARHMQRFAITLVGPRPLISSTQPSGVASNEGAPVHSELSSPVEFEGYVCVITPRSGCRSPTVFANTPPCHAKWPRTLARDPELYLTVTGVVVQVNARFSVRVCEELQDVLGDQVIIMDTSMERRAVPTGCCCFQSPPTRRCGG